MDKSKDSWIFSCRNPIFENNTLKVELRRANGSYIYNELGIHPLLRNTNLTNCDGIFKYDLTKQEDDIIMGVLFPLYQGVTIPSITIQQAIMLSVNIPKYNTTRNQTFAHLKNFNLPPISVYFGFTPNTVTKSYFYQFMDNTNQRNEHTLGMLEIFNKFVKENEDKGNNWLLYFEDDVRVSNLDMSEDLTRLYNVPEDAELIRPYIGKNEPIDLKHVQYSISYGGGNNHAFYISRDGCKKVLNYATKYKWKYICDIDIYKLSKYCENFPTGFDGWSFKACNGKNDITRKLAEDEKINMYHLSHRIFNQTSLPVAD